MLKRESYTFNGISELPSVSWNQYFSNSAIGNEYEVLWDTDTKELLMSNTEVEHSTNKLFFDSIFNECNVLSIGYGIGFINEMIRKRNARLTVIEKNQEVINLETKNIDDIRVIIGDAFNFNYESIFENEKFDIVYWDPSGGNENLFVPWDQLKSILKPNGKIIAWNIGGSSEM